MKINMKKYRLAYEDWTCILNKDVYSKRIDTNFFQGYLRLIYIHEVSEPQIWHFNGEDIIVCDKGMKWLTILSQDEFYCITVMFNEKDEIVGWYIDMIAGQGIDSDGVAYIDDLYLDLVVYPDGTVLEDDMDELEEALAQGDIRQELFDLAINTGKKLKNGLLSEIDVFKEYTMKCFNMIASAENN